MSVDKVGKLQRNKRQRVTRLGKDGLAPAAAWVSLGDTPLGQSSRSSKDRHRPLPLIRGPGAVTETEAQGGRTRRLPGPGGGATGTVARLQAPRHSLERFRRLHQNACKDTDLHAEMVTMVKL